MALMVRQLTGVDAPLLEDLYRKNPLRFLTPRMNLEVYGFDGPTICSWGAFTPDGSALQGILLRFNNTAIIADLDGSAAAAFAPTVDGERGLFGVRGTMETVRRLRANLRRYTTNGLEQSTYMQLVMPPVCPPEILRLARPARPDDLDMLVALYAGAYTMFRTRDNVQAKLAETRVFVVEEKATGRSPARISACALLNMEGRDAGLIGGVFTAPLARGKGYAGACTAALCLDLQRDGKLPCLFYENPIAGRVYHRLGFEEIGQWGVLYLNKG